MEASQVQIRQLVDFVGRQLHQSHAPLIGADTSRGTNLCVGGMLNEKIYFTPHRSQCRDRRPAESA